MADQLQQWESEFGDEYTQRNVFDPNTRKGAFNELLDGLSSANVLEIGCNRGHNLQVLASVLGPQARLVGVEPNESASDAAQSIGEQVEILQGALPNLPFEENAFDLVFTAGALIYIHPDDLAAAIREMARVSRQYLLAIEYWAEEETTIHYRGHDNMLWKRDFRKAFEEELPALHCMRTGYLGPEHGFDRCHWWLWDMRSAQG